jgi:3-oxoacyl-[acyl-carrier-protein] synthase-3
VGARIAGLGVYLPERTRSTAETERDLRDANPSLKLPTGLIHRMTGVESVHVREDGWQTSDLAVAAARIALEESPGGIDLVIFAAASQDLIEPATSHIVAAKLGLECPVMDIKNACNSVINAMEGATALITSGQYRRVLFACGDEPSEAVRWSLRDNDQFMRSFPG